MTDEQSMDGDNHPSAANEGSSNARASSSRHWLAWFVGGFAATFVALALFVTVHVMMPSYGGVVQCKLWRYYLFEIQQTFDGTPNYLGPYHRDPLQVFRTGGQHLLLAIPGGLLALGAAWASRRFFQ